MNHRFGAQYAVEAFEIISYNQDKYHKFSKDEDIENAIIKLF